MATDIANQEDGSTTPLEPDPIVQDYLQRHHHYCLDSFICSGSTCAVFKTIQLVATTGRPDPAAAPLATKVICHSKVPTKYLNQMMANELSIVRRVSHPNIVRVVEVIESLANYSLIITEFAQDGDLLQYIQKNEDTIQNIPLYRKWFIHVVQALSYLHSQGIGHRDIKADNILLCSGTAKLADFGYAVLFHDQYGSPVLCHTFCGTPEYASPEILCHAPYNVAISDCFSLGVLLYLLVARKLPFGYGTAIRSKSGTIAHYQKIMNKQWEVVEVIEQDPHLHSLLSLLLYPYVKERIRAANVLQHPWITSRR